MDVLPWISKRSRAAVTTSGVLALAAVAAQVAYPLLDGRALVAATLASVLLFVASCVTHAAAAFGLRAGAALLAGAVGIGLAAESIGVRTGFPFGEYSYAGSLGAQILGVPVVVPLAWAMMAYPCLLLGRRLGGRVGGQVGGRVGGRVGGQVGSRWLVALTGGCALASWDLFLDPQMVDAGHWTWAWPHPDLRGVPGVPLTNYAGWLAVAILITATLDRLLPPGLPEPAPVEAVPAGLLAWTWLGSIVANLTFFDRPWVALYGGIIMGASVAPYLLATRRAVAAARRAAWAGEAVTRVDEIRSGS